MELIETFKTQCRPKYRLLTEEQIKKIHSASLEILEKIGVRVSHEERINFLLKIYLNL